MRTEINAEKLYKKSVPLITGRPLLPFFTLCLSHSINGMPKGALFKEDNGFNLLGLDITPRRYWETLSRNGILALITQEFIHGKSLKHIPKILEELEKKVYALKKDFPRESSKELYLREIILREEYEIKYNLIIPMLNWKLHVDYNVIKHLRDKKLPTIGYLEVLQSELEEESRQTNPKSRKIAKVNLVKMRIYHLNLLLKNNQQSIYEATTLRKNMEKRSIKILSVLSGSTLSTV